ncbi:uncharacterized protein N7518_005329, partial [Penicillium psychrosexuale]|uniref:uncharacterized protein n=1 Tax=Penicillium psychrosexuale TaxID=1002107 RepID=UPI002545631A
IKLYLPSEQVASRLCPGSTTKLYPVPAPFPVTITLTLFGHKPNRPPSFLSLPDFFFPSLSNHSSPFLKFSHTRGIRSLHIHLKTAVLSSTPTNARLPLK